MYVRQQPLTSFPNPAPHGEAEFPESQLLDVCLDLPLEHEYS